MRTILAYGMGALPETADEGQVFINVTTGEQLIYKKGEWKHEFEEPAPVKAEPKKAKKKEEKPVIEETPAEEPVKEEAENA